MENINDNNDIVVIDDGQMINITSLLPLLTYTQIKKLETQIKKEQKDNILKYSVTYNDEERKFKTLEDASKYSGKSVATMHRILKGTTQVEGLQIKIL